MSKKPYLLLTDYLLNNPTSTLLYSASSSNASLSKSVIWSEFNLFLSTSKVTSYFKPSESRLVSCFCNFISWLLLADDLGVGGSTELPWWVCAAWRSVTVCWLGWMSLIVYEFRTINTLVSEGTDGRDDFDPVCY